MTHLLPSEKAQKDLGGTPGKTAKLKAPRRKRKWRSGGVANVERALLSRSLNAANVKVLLSIDPGLAEIGYAVFYGPKTIRKYGMIQTSPRKDLTYRLKLLHYKLRKLIKTYGCEHILIEEFQGAMSMQNRAAAMDVAKAHGATQVLPRPVTLVSTISVRPQQKERNREKRKHEAIKLVKQHYGIALKFKHHHVADAILQGRWFYEKETA